jgi:hypothetical protein
MARQNLSRITEHWKNYLSCKGRGFQALSLSPSLETSVFRLDLAMIDLIGRYICRAALLRCFAVFWEPL